MLNKDGINMDVKNIYFLGKDEPTKVSEGTCKFFMQGMNMEGIFCGAKTDIQGRRYISIVSFDSASN